MIRAGLVVALAFVSAAAQDSGFADAVRRGNDLMRAGKYAEAAAVYETQAKTRSADAGLRANLGMAYSMAGRPADAVPHLEAAAKLQPGSPPVLVMLGQAYLAIGDPARAVAPLSAAASAAPAMSEAHQLLAQALLESGQPDKAVPEFERWTVSEARNPAAWYGLARSCQSAAAEQTGMLLRETPESGEALALLAAKSHKSGNYGRAFFLYRRALERNPQLPGVHAAVAEIYRAMGHSDWSDKERAKEPGRAAARPSGRYSRTLELLQCTERARNRVEALGESVELHAMRAFLARENARYGDSVAEWRAALAAAPGSVQLEKELAVTLRLNEDHAAAYAIAAKLVKLLPDSAEINYLTGQILVSDQEPVKAIAYLRKAAALNPAFLPARGSLGLALLQLGRDVEAIPHLEAALPLDSDGSYHLRLSRAYGKSGAKAASARALARYRELQSRSTDTGESATDLVITPP